VLNIRASLIKFRPTFLIAPLPAYFLRIEVLVPEKRFVISFHGTRSIASESQGLTLKYMGNLVYGNCCGRALGIIVQKLDIAV